MFVVTRQMDMKKVSVAQESVCESSQNSISLETQLSRADAAKV